jgi:glutaminyl-tRNA synthetase
LRTFCERVGVTKFASRIDLSWLEDAARSELNARAQRRMAVLEPLKVVITNYPADAEELVEAIDNPEDPASTTRQVPFCGELWIEREDFTQTPNRKWHRLAPGAEVRLRYGYFITCEEVIERDGAVVELRCRYDPATHGGNAPDGRKVKGTIHWVSARHAVAAEVRLYDRLFAVEQPGRDPDLELAAELNPQSLVVLDRCYLEPALATASRELACQFERKGYFIPDPDSTATHLIFNRVVTLRDSWTTAQAT